MPSPNEAKWKRNAERYVEFSNLPHCIGAKDGKLIRVKYFLNRDHFTSKRGAIVR
jgi:hypothetical protein